MKKQKTKTRTKAAPLMPITPDMMMANYERDEAARRASERDDTLRRAANPQRRLAARGSVRG